MSKFIAWTITVIPPCISNRTPFNQPLPSWNSSQPLQFYSHSLSCFNFTFKDFKATSDFAGYPPASFLSYTTKPWTISRNTNWNSSYSLPASLADLFAPDVTYFILGWFKSKLPKLIYSNWFHSALEIYLQPFSVIWLQSISTQRYIAILFWYSSSQFY